MQYLLNFKIYKNLINIHNFDLTSVSPWERYPIMENKFQHSN